MQQFFESCHGGNAEHFLFLGMSGAVLLVGFSCFGRSSSLHNQAILRWAERIVVLTILQ